MTTSDHVPAATATPKPPPTGTGYGRPPPACHRTLVEVDAGTPMGEYFRRHWHPVAIARDVGATPRRLRLLCENLVIFRDLRGRVGVVDERCAHRQASLYYGRVEEDGIRCAYHGWLFDVEGHCRDQAVEPEGGKFRDKVRQAWYSVREQYGLVFVYMGPPDKMPLLPRYDVLEGLGEDEELAVALDSLPGSNGSLLPTNWLIDMDNIHDMGHAMWLHELHSGPQFGPAFFYVNQANAAACQQSYEYVETPRGMYSRGESPLPDGTIVSTILETQLPLLRIIHPPFLIGRLGGIINWCVPVDNESHLTITLMRVPKGSPVLGNPMADWDRSDPETVRRQPSDHEIQASQGPIQMHSLEHLASSDRGVIKMRRQYQRELERLARGEPLANVVYEPGQELFEVLASSTVVRAAPEEAALVAHDKSLSDHSEWQVVIKTPMGDDQARFALTIAHGQVSGQIVNERETVAVQDGVADGHTLRWVSKLTKPVPMKLSFTATLDGDQISGGAKSLFGTAKFSGHRV